MTDITSEISYRHAINQRNAIDGLIALFRGIDSLASRADHIGPAHGKALRHALIYADSAISDIKMERARLEDDILSYERRHLGKD